MFMFNFKFYNLKLLITQFSRSEMTAKLAQQNDDVIRPDKKSQRSWDQSGQGKNFGHKVFS